MPGTNVYTKSRSSKEVAVLMGSHLKYCGRPATIACS